ncbi:unnamed protein product [Effrenium voratum]|nr:unnamed protein product [Effrenium voratum]CAJ1428501.1 unnamed protein product [Effrenium voratum]
MAPLLQEQASKSFPGSLMVLAETLTYFFGGLSLALMWEGLHGIRKCFQPLRYLAFMPASLAFSWAGFMTYPAIKGFGASQFYLLAQLRVAIIAVFMRLASQVRQPASVWISLLQLVVGMVVLVWYKASAVAGEVGCHFLPAAALKAPDAGPGEESEEQTSFLLSFAAMVGVIITSAFGTLYLERQLKSSPKDPLFIQLHQLNAVGLTGALLVATQSLRESPEEDLGDTTPVPEAMDVGDSPHLLPLRVAMSVSCVVARGALNGSVLKKLDALTKGLIDVTAIVLCTVIQVLAQGRPTDATAMGLQMMMLLAVLGFVSARQPAPAAPPLDERLPMTRMKSGGWPWELKVQQPVPKAL